MEVFWIATSKKCNRIILVHNHIGSNLTPSDADKRITNKLQQGGVLLGIDILDHLIITEKNGYLSFDDEGLL